MDQDINPQVNEIVSLFEIEEVNRYLSLEAWRLLKVLARRTVDKDEYPEYILGWVLDLPAKHPGS